MKLERLLERACGTPRSPPPEPGVAHLPRRSSARAGARNSISSNRSRQRPRSACRAPLVHRSPTRREECRRALRLYHENMRLLRLIKNCHFVRGRVDCRWRHPPERSKLYYQNRVNFAERVQLENRAIHQRLTSAVPRLTTTAELRRWWAELSEHRAAPAAHLRPPDPVFDAPAGVQRPRVTLKLRFREGGAVLGSLRLELFSETCPRTAALFLSLLQSRPGYVGTCFFRAVDYFYSSAAGVSNASRYTLVRVSGAGALRGVLTLEQEHLEPQEELLLVERLAGGGAPELGALRAAAAAAVAAATAALPAPPQAVPRPDLQALLSTNEIEHDLRKILISLVEAGARLAAAGPRYERALAQLSAALADPAPPASAVQEVITPEEIERRMAAERAASVAPTPAPAGGAEPYHRAVLLQRFLDAFRAWRVSRQEPPSAEALSALAALGFGAEAAAAALARVGGSVPAAAAWLAGERGASVTELVDGLPDDTILHKLLQQPQIQRGLLNTRMLSAFVGLAGGRGGAALWRGSPLLAHVSRAYHAEKYCRAVNQFSADPRKVPGLFWSGGDVARDCGYGLGLPGLPVLPPENFHYPHSVPGLLTMDPRDNEVFGHFSITFKPLPHLDLNSVVFGRVVQPSRTFELMRDIGHPISMSPVVEICGAVLQPPRPSGQRAASVRRRRNT